jgi:light-regulated signal transduction histidine kinase (bacteriophytochrome)
MSDRPAENENDAGSPGSSIDHREEASRRLEERSHQLEEAQKELDAFSYAVSHELRAPLRTMAGITQVLLTGAESLPDDAKPRIAALQRLALQMDEMVKALLEFSRIGSRELFRTNVDPAELARQALEGLSADMEGREIGITIGELPSCMGMRSLIRQVYANLIANAIKFTRKREKAVIEIGARQEHGGTVYFVKDNGIGFPDDAQERLFTLFCRLHDNGEYEGTGVGLALSRRIIQRHGGRIWAEGIADQGATFFFTIPG